MRCAGLQLCFTRLCCFILLGVGSPEIAAQTLRSAENSHFEIVALDTRSIRFVDTLSRHIAETAGQFLDRRRMAFPQRILVRLKPGQYVDFQGAYRTTIGERGFVTVDLLWDENLSLMQCCRALSEALLLRYSHYHHGPSAAENLREWTVASLGTRSFFKLRPALHTVLAEEFQQRQPRQLAVLLSRKWDATPREGSGYWVFQSLQQSGLPPRKIREMFVAAVAGEDVSPILVEILQSNNRAVNLEDWWAQVRLASASAQRAVFEDLAGSRQWIGELSEFELEEKPANLRQIWMQRDKPAVRKILEARLELLRIRITRVNPAYFNAARSLGLLFETMLQSDQSHEFIGALSQFLGDFEDTKEIERMVEEELLQPRG
jgi:hypothetical protein